MCVFRPPLYSSLIHSSLSKSPYMYLYKLWTSFLPWSILSFKYLAFMLV